MRVQGAGFRIQASGFGVRGSGFRVQGSGFRVRGSGFRVQGSRLRFQGVGCTSEATHQTICGARMEGGGWRERERERETDRERESVGLMRTSETTHHTMSGARTSSHDLQGFGSRVQDLVFGGEGFRFSGNQSLRCRVEGLVFGFAVHRVRFRV